MFDRSSVRPSALSGVMGQESIVARMRAKADLYIKKGQVPAHSLLIGPSGYGKTTLCRSYANEMGASFYPVMVPEVPSWDSLLATLMLLKRGDVLFLDEVHALKPSWQERLYGALEDFSISKSEPFKAPERFDVGPFTCVAATTHVGHVNGPLLSRFGKPLVMAPYTLDQLASIVAGAVRALGDGIHLSHDVARCVAALSLGTPRCAVNLGGSLLEQADLMHMDRQVTANDLGAQVLEAMIRAEGIDPFYGLDSMCRRYIKVIIGRRRPVGLETLAQILGEAPETIQRYVEPHLIKDSEFAVFGRVVRGPMMVIDRGRLATQAAHDYYEGCIRLQSERGFFQYETL